MLSHSTFWTRIMPWALLALLVPDLGRAATFSNKGPSLKQRVRSIPANLLIKTMRRVSGRPALRSLLDAVADRRATPIERSLDALTHSYARSNQTTWLATQRERVDLYTAFLALQQAPWYRQHERRPLEIAVQGANAAHLRRVVDGHIQHRIESGAALVGVLGPSRSLRWLARTVGLTDDPLTMLEQDIDELIAKDREAAVAAAAILGQHAYSELLRGYGGGAKIAELEDTLFRSFRHKGGMNRPARTDLLQRFQDRLAPYDNARPSRDGEHREPSLRALLTRDFGSQIAQAKSERVPVATIALRELEELIDRRDHASLELALALASHFTEAPTRRQALRELGLAESFRAMFLQLWQTRNELGLQLQERTAALNHHAGMLDANDGLGNTKALRAYVQALERAAKSGLCELPDLVELEVADLERPTRPPGEAASRNVRPLFGEGGRNYSEARRNIALRLRLSPLDDALRNASDQPQ